MLRFERNLVEDWDKGLHRVLEPSNTEGKKTNQTIIKSSTSSNVAQHREHDVGTEGKANC